MKANQRKFQLINTSTWGLIYNESLKYLFSWWKFTFGGCFLETFGWVWLPAYVNGYKVDSFKKPNLCTLGSFWKESTWEVYKVTKKVPCHFDLHSSNWKLLLSRFCGHCLDSRYPFAGENFSRSLPWLMIEQIMKTIVRKCLFIRK